MKRLVAVLLVLVGTTAMSFAGECSTHGISYITQGCPRCFGENQAFEGKENDCKTQYSRHDLTTRNNCHRGYYEAQKLMKGE